MKCPKCNKAELKEDISYKAENPQKGYFFLYKTIGSGAFLNYYRIYTFFCPLCNFRKEKRISISAKEYSTGIKAKSKRGTEAKAEINFKGLSIKTKGKKE